MDFAINSDQGFMVNATIVANTIEEETTLVSIATVFLISSCPDVNKLFIKVISAGVMGSAERAETLKGLKGSAVWRACMFVPVKSSDVILLQIKTPSQMEKFES